MSSLLRLFHRPPILANATRTEIRPYDVNRREDWVVQDSNARRRRQEKNFNPPGIRPRIVVQTLSDGESRVFQAGRYFDRSCVRPMVGAINSRKRFTTLHGSRLCWSLRSEERPAHARNQDSSRSARIASRCEESSPSISRMNASIPPSSSIVSNTGASCLAVSRSFGKVVLLSRKSATT